MKRRSRSLRDDLPGLADLEGVDDVRVRWVDGQEQNLGSFSADRVVLLWESERAWGL